MTFIDELAEWIIKTKRESLTYVAGCFDIIKWSFGMDQLPVDEIDQIIRNLGIIIRTARNIKKDKETKNEGDKNASNVE